MRVTGQTLASLSVCYDNSCVIIIAFSPVVYHRPKSAPIVKSSPEPDTKVADKSPQPTPRKLEKSPPLVARGPPPLGEAVALSSVGSQESDSNTEALQHFSLDVNASPSLALCDAQADSPVEEVPPSASLVEEIPPSASLVEEVPAEVVINSSAMLSSSEDTPSLSDVEETGLSAGSIEDPPIEEDDEEEEGEEVDLDHYITKELEELMAKLSEASSVEYRLSSSNRVIYYEGQEWFYQDLTGTEPRMQPGKC